MTVRNVALASITLLLAMAVNIWAQPAARGCVYGRWLPPHELRAAEGYTVSLARPVITALGRETLLTGFPVLTFDSARNVVWPLAGAMGSTPIRVEQLAMGAIDNSASVARLVPAPSSLAIGPKNGFEGAIDDRGVAHFVFGSNDSTPIQSLMNVRSLWYTHFDGQRWGAPVRLLRTDGIVMWTPSNRSSLVASGNTLNLVVVVMGEGLRYLRNEGGTWISRHIDLPANNAGYPRIAVLRSGRVVLLIQGDPAYQISPSTSGFHATWSDDRGATWAPLVSVSDSSGEPAFDAQLVADEQDVLRAFWFRQTDDQGRPATGVSIGGSPGRVHVAESRDEGATWLNFAPAPLLPNAGELVVLPLADHSVLVALADRGGQIITTSWRQQWRPFEELSGTPFPNNPTLGLGGAQRPVLAWGILDDQRIPGTMLSTLVPCQ